MVPIIAGKIPPAVIESLGPAVMNSQEMAGRPRQSKKPQIKTNAPILISAAPRNRVNIKASNRLRRLSLEVKAIIVASYN